MRARPSCPPEFQEVKRQLLSEDTGHAAKYLKSYLTINHGADVNYRDEENTSWLHAAAQSGNVDAINLLLERGANRTLYNNDRKTAIDIAAQNGHWQAVIALAKNFSDIDRQAHCENALILAAEAGELAAVDTLLDSLTLMLTPYTITTIARKTALDAALECKNDPQHKILERILSRTLSNSEHRQRVLKRALSTKLIDAIRLILKFRPATDEHDLKNIQSGFLFIFLGYFLELYNEYCAAKQSIPAKLWSLFSTPDDEKTSYRIRLRDFAKTLHLIKNNMTITDIEPDEVRAKSYVVCSGSQRYANLRQQFFKNHAFLLLPERDPKAPNEEKLLNEYREFIDFLQHIQLGTALSSVAQDMLTAIEQAVSAQPALHASP